MLPANMSSTQMVKFFEMILKVNASTAEGYKVHVNHIEQQQKTISDEIDALNNYLDDCDNYLEKTETENDLLYLRRQYNNLEKEIDKAKEIACNKSLARIELLQKAFQKAQKIL